MLSHGNPKPMPQQTTYNPMNHILQVPGIADMWGRQSQIHLYIPLKQQIKFTEKLQQL
jgi:hypothetical protein